MTESSALSLLEGFARSVIQDGEDLDHRLECIWERAAGSLPPDNAWVYREWFMVKFQKGLYLAAKKVGHLSLHLVLGLGF